MVRTNDDREGRERDVRRGHGSKRELLHIRRPNEGVEVEVGTAITVKINQSSSSFEKKEEGRENAQLHRKRVQHIRSKPPIKRQRSSLLQNPQHHRLCRRSLVPPLAAEIQSSRCARALQRLGEGRGRAVCDGAGGGRGFEAGRHFGLDAGFDTEKKQERGKISDWEQTKRRTSTYVSRGYLRTG